MTRQLEEIMSENKETLKKFAELFIAKLGDEELINTLAERDLEKLARVFKLVFDKLDTEETKPSAALEAIIGAVGGLGGENDG